MTINVKAEFLAEAIMRLAEEDKGLVKSKLVEMIQGMVCCDDPVHRTNASLAEATEYARELYEQRAESLRGARSIMAKEFF